MSIFNKGQSSDSSGQNSFTGMSALNFQCDQLGKLDQIVGTNKNMVIIRGDVKNLKVSCNVNVVIAGFVNDVNCSGVGNVSIESNPDTEDLITDFINGSICNVNTSSKMFVSTKKNNNKQHSKNGLNINAGGNVYFNGDFCKMDNYCVQSSKGNTTIIKKGKTYTIKSPGGISIINGEFYDEAGKLINLDDFEDTESKETINQEINNPLPSEYLTYNKKHKIDSLGISYDIDKDGLLSSVSLTHTGPEVNYLVVTGNVETLNSSGIGNINIWGGSDYLSCSGVGNVNIIGNPQIKFDHSGVGSVKRF